MKNRLTAITFAAILFAAVLLSLSCKDTSQNNTMSNTTANNTVANVNQNNSVQNSESVSTLAFDCNGTNEQKITKVNAKMLQNIQGDLDLQKQYSNGKFNFNVAENSGNVVLYIWGRVHTEKEDKVDDLNKTFKKFVKKGCVAKVIFGEPAKDKATTSQGFEYSLCEYPNEVCSNGECRLGCLVKIEDNTNANSNMGN